MESKYSIADIAGSIYVVDEEEDIILEGAVVVCGVLKNINAGKHTDVLQILLYTAAIIIRDQGDVCRVQGYIVYEGM